MANDVSIKFGVDGEKQFKSALTAVNEQVKSLNGQFDSAIKAMATTTDKESAMSNAFNKGTEALKAQKTQIETLNTKLESQKKKYDELGEALKKATSDGDTQAINKLTVEFNNQATAIYKTEQQLNKANNEYARTTQLMDDIPDMVDDMGDSMDSAGGKASLFGSILSAQVVSDLIISGFKKLAEGIKEVATASAQYADDILTMSSVTGLSTDTLQEFQYMEDLVDVSLDTVTGSLTKLTRNMQSASKGTGDAYKAFNELGVSVQDANGELRNNEEVFYEVIDALGKIENETQRDAYAMNIFGKSAQDLNPLIEAGSQKLGELAQEAHDVGYVMGDEALQANGSLQDSFDRMNKVIDVLKNNLGTALAPALSDIVNTFNELALALGDSEKVGAVFSDLVLKLSDYLMEGLPTLINTALDILLSFVNALTENIPQIVPVAIEVITTLVTTLLEHLPDLILSAIELVVAIVKGIYDSLPQIAESGIKICSTLLQALKTNFKNIISNAKTWGKDLIDSFVNGILGSIQKVVNAVKQVAGKVKDFLGFSEPKEGPLSNFHTYAPDMMNLYAQGMIDNIGVVKNASEKVAEGITFGNSSSGNGFGGNIVVQSILDGRIIGESVYNYSNQRKLMYGV